MVVRAPREGVDGSRGKRIQPREESWELIGRQAPSKRPDQAVRNRQAGFDRCSANGLLLPSIGESSDHNATRIEAVRPHRDLRSVLESLLKTASRSGTK